MTIDVNGTTSDKSVVWFVRNGFAIFLPYFVCVGTFGYLLYKYKCRKLKQCIASVLLLVLLLLRLLWIFTEDKSDLNVDVSEIIICYCLMNDLVHSVLPEEETAFTKWIRTAIWFVFSVPASLSFVIWYTDSHSQAGVNAMGIEVSKLIFTILIIIIQCIICLKLKLTKICKKIFREDVARKDMNESTESPRKLSVNSIHPDFGESGIFSDQARMKAESSANLTPVQYLDPNPVGPSDSIFMALQDQLKTHKILLFKIEQRNFLKEEYGPDPVIVMCHKKTRLIDDIKSTLKGIQSCDYQRVILIVLHLTNKQYLPTTSSEEKMKSDPNFKDLRKIVDVGCLSISDTKADIYECPTNTKALETIGKLF